MKEIAYLDNAATTRVCGEGIAAVTKTMEADYGNPSSLHGMGARAARLLREAREQVAGLMGCESECVYFTGGGSESNNLAVFGGAMARKHNRHLVTTAAEHSSVTMAVKRLCELGWEAHFIKPEPDGSLNPEKVAAAVRPDTGLVSVMAVNNETGAIFPIEDICKRVRAVQPRALIHCDGVQMLGKLPMKASRIPADLISVSGHKICGPKGVGALYIRRDVHIPPLIYGGGQEKGMRSGTEDTPMIAGFGAACARLSGHVQENLERAGELWALLRGKLLEIPEVEILSPVKGRSPYILNFSIPGYRGETVLHFLEEKGVYVSSGSACSKGALSPVLSAMGLSRRVAEGALRVSFIYDTADWEIERLVSALKEAISGLAH